MQVEATKIVIAHQVNDLVLGNTTYETKMKMSASDSEKYIPLCFAFSFLYTPGCVWYNVQHNTSYTENHIGVVHRKRMIRHSVEPPNIKHNNYECEYSSYVRHISA